MHFSIPETESRSGDSGGSAYVVRSSKSWTGRGGDNGLKPWERPPRPGCHRSGLILGSRLAAAYFLSQICAEVAPLRGPLFGWQLSQAAALVGVTGRLGKETAAQAPEFPLDCPSAVLGLEPGKDRLPNS